MSCAGCEARDRQIAWLQDELRRREERSEKQLESQQDRLLALVNPAALAQVRGQVPAAGAPQGTPEVAPAYVTKDGKAYVTVNGVAVPAEDYAKLMSGGGFIDGEGHVIPVEEQRRAQNMLDYMIGGGRS